MKKWAVNFFDGVNVLYRVVYADFYGYTVVDKFLLDDEEGGKFYIREIIEKRSLDC